MEHYIEKLDELTKSIIQASFPNYQGKKVKVSTDIPNSLDSYWNEGSINYYCFVQLSTLNSAAVKTNHPYFEKGNPRDLESLPDGLILVKHSIFCGKDMGITIYANAKDLAPLLPAKEELTYNEKLVLHMTRYKSSYAGIKDYRYHRVSSKVKREDWDLAKESLISKGMLNKAGAVTAKGKNNRPPSNFK